MNFRENDIKEALKKIDQNPTLRTGRESAEYDLVYQGGFYPPILVLSEANRINGKARLTLRDFENSTDKAFKYLRDLGFQVVKKRRPEKIDKGLQEQAAFLKEWPIEKLKNITLEQYTNLDRDTAFIYWLEKKTENSGSIWGGSAYKFGIYRRANLSTKIDDSKYYSDGKYAWYRHLGETREDVWKKVKENILAIANLSVKFDFESIDEIEMGAGVKWKIAFHYNPENIVPIFKAEWLVNAAQSLGLEDASKMKVSDLHKFLISKKPIDITTLEYASRLWSKYNTKNFYYVIDLF